MEKLNNKPRKTKTLGGAVWFWVEERQAWFRLKDFGIEQ